MYLLHSGTKLPRPPMLPDDPAASADAREVLTPSAFNRLVRDLLEDSFPLIWIEGELSNVARPASGHFYFTLKDAAAQVRCAMFKPRSTFLRFRPGDGQRVLARARVSLYEPRGEFQLIVEHLEEAGEGALRREFERLKAQLAAEGLFDIARKRPLPRLPQRIALITSPSGAAVRDILSILRRRFALAEVEILSVPVQGREAPPAVVAALLAASAARRHDVIVLTRGGGSLEDLWAFNDETVARAIAASTVPVISAIGHEIDFTIADFVADLRAPTPSAAAELLAPDARELARMLCERRDRLVLLMHRLSEALGQRADHLFARLAARHPQARLQAGSSRLDVAQRRLAQLVRDALSLRRHRLRSATSRFDAQSPTLRLDAERRRLRVAGVDLRRETVRALEHRVRHLSELARALNAISPLATLGRGYAILFGEGRVLRSAAEVRAVGRIRAKLVDGEIDLHTGVNQADSTP